MEDLLVRIYSWFLGGRERLPRIALWLVAGIFLILVTSLFGGGEGAGDSLRGGDWAICKSWGERRRTPNEGSRFSRESGALYWFSSCAFFWLLRTYFFHRVGRSIGSRICASHILRISSFRILGVFFEQLFVCPYEFFGRLLPPGSPTALSFALFWIEVFGVCIRVLTLRIRLLANLLVGGILVYLWVGVATHLKGALTFLGGELIFSPWGGTSWVVILFSTLAFCWRWRFVGLIMAYEICVSGFQAFLYFRLILHYFRDAGARGVTKIGVLLAYES